MDSDSPIVDYDSRKAKFRVALWRERNGAVATAMHCYGEPYKINCGVSLPTIRQLARAEAPDRAFACCLYREEVRELRLAALHMAEPDRLTLADLPDLETGIINSEVAEEAAFALLSRAPIFPKIFAKWVVDDNWLPVYAALLAASRRPDAPIEWVDMAIRAVHRLAESAAAGALPAYAVKLAAHGAAALLLAVGNRGNAERQAVLAALGSSGMTPAEAELREEVESLLL